MLGRIHEGNQINQTPQNHNSFIRNKIFSRVLGPTVFFHVWFQLNIGHDRLRNTEFEPKYTQMGHKWGTNGAQMGHKWCTNGAQMGHYNTHEINFGHRTNFMHVFVCLYFKFERANSCATMQALFEVERTNQHNM